MPKAGLSCEVKYGLIEFDFEFGSSFDVQCKQQGANYQMPSGLCQSFKNEFQSKENKIEASTEPKIKIKFTFISKL